MCLSNMRTATENSRLLMKHRLGKFKKKPYMEVAFTVIYLVPLRGNTLKSRISPQKKRKVTKQFSATEITPLLHHFYADRPVLHV